MRPFPIPCRWQVLQCSKDWVNKWCEKLVRVLSGVEDEAGSKVSDSRVWKLGCNVPQYFSGSVVFVLTMAAWAETAARIVSVTTSEDCDEGWSFMVVDIRVRISWRWRKTVEGENKDMIWSERTLQERWEDWVLIGIFGKNQLTSAHYGSPTWPMRDA